MDKNKRPHSLITTNICADRVNIDLNEHDNIENISIF